MNIPDPPATTAPGGRLITDWDAELESLRTGGPQLRTYRAAARPRLVVAILVRADVVVEVYAADRERWQVMREDGGELTLDDAFVFARKFLAEWRPGGVEFRGIDAEEWPGR
ncbi:hypothetical protein [Salinibacterium sp. ZJ454]|uniref:hypothetical protein n=1 Tax=Salinibacterium sp. ZJ454 TaxID=2708339 RepID=UPI0014215D4D|nr:hypothetical protein [Salinibacterium sp. ZJ454]